MKLLVFSWIYEYTLSDILSTFNDLNISFDIIKMDLSEKDKSCCPELYDCIVKSLTPVSYDAVFTVNYFPDIARACFDNKTIYISWSYDCPLDIRNMTETIALPTNRAFFFDKNQFLEYKNSSNTVFHMPLAVNSKRLANIKPSNKYSSQISFVGRIYHSTYPELKQYLDDYYIGYLDSIIQAQKKLYGVYLSPSVLTDDIINDINQNFIDHNCPYTLNNQRVNREQLSVSLVSESTFENRLLCLGLLSRQFDLKWYTTPDSAVLPNIQKCPPVSYLTEMPLVFRSSLLNLHIGLHAISSGISLRQLDIMACNGFLLSSYQPELFDYFIPGEDFDYFTCAEEAYDKCSFYLNNLDLIRKIAESGMEKTHQQFNYNKILSSIIELSFQ